MERELTASLPRNRYTDEEWALVVAGKCVKQTSYGTGRGDTFCEAAAPDDHVPCVEHQERFFANTGRKPTAGGF